MSTKSSEKAKIRSRERRTGIMVFGSVLIALILLLGLIALASSKNDPIQRPGSPLADRTWVRTGGPMGGRGYDIRMRPDNPDILYVTDQYAGVHKSTDGGQTWFPINNGIDARAGSSGDAIPTFCLTIDPNNYDIIWAGTLEFRGVYRSTDGGTTWEKRVNGIDENLGLTFRGFTIEPGNSNVVYAAGEIGLGPGFNFSRSKGLVYKTIDGGLTWHEIWRGDNVARYVWIDPTNHNTLYVSTGIWDREAANSNGAAGIAGGVGILKSTDGGATWRQINNGLNNLYIGTLFMHPANPQILLAGAGAGTSPCFLAGSGVYLTTDGGEHWTLVTNSNPFITSVEFSTKDPKIAYAGGIGFYRSDDGGWNWTLYETMNGFWGPPGIRSGVVIDFQADPRAGMRLFANNYNGGNVVSEDGGETWQTATKGYVGSDVDNLTVHPRNAALVYACEKGNPYVSADGGATWRGINNIVNPFPAPDSQKIIIDPSDSQHLLMSQRCDARAYESHDAGATWYITADYRDELMAKHGNVDQSFLTLAFAPSKPNKVYGGFGTSVCGALTPDLMNKTPIMSFLISEDGGHTWIRRDGTALDGWSVTDIVVHPTNANIAWASTAGAGVFRTIDGGTSWQSLSTGLSALVLAGLALNPKNTNELYAAAPDRGVFKTDNGCITWRQVSAGMNPNESIAQVVIDPVRSNVVYAASQTSGVFVSEDAGESWRLINNGLRTRAVRSLGISSDGKVLYAGTIGEGVFRLGEATAATDDFVGAWPGVGVCYRNSDSGRWIYLETSSPSQIAAGDLDGDNIDDLIGVFPSDPGVWAKKSTTHSWVKLDSQTPNWIAVGDMNGDGRPDFVGAWNNGVFYKDSASGSWVLMEVSAANQIAAGDLDGDGKADLIGIFPSDPGVWMKKSSTQSWVRLDSLTPAWITVGDMNGDGRPDLMGTWPGSGVYYKNSATGTWTLLETSVASQVVAGDLDGDGRKDLIGVFPTDPGVWTKKSSTQTWQRLDAQTPSWIAAGKMRAAGMMAGLETNVRMPSGTPVGDFIRKGRFEDLSATGPSGRYFKYAVEKNTRIGGEIDQEAQRRMTPGPGELGFKPTKDENSTVKIKKQ
jgi:photosystem II stability/assembly factor-like uncharacterized protein